MALNDKVRRFMNNKNFKKGSGFKIVLIILGLSLCLISGTYAAYNNMAFQRGVVRNRDSEEIRFTSNILKSYIASGEQSEKYEMVLYPFSENTKEEDKLTIPLKIANYLINNDNLFSEKDITFNLSIHLTGYQEGTQYTVNGMVIQNGSIEIPNVTLTGRKPKEIDYEIGITGKDLNKLAITIVATTTNLSGNKTLAACIYPCTNSQVNPFSYSGTFLYEKSSSPSDYYGYNYEVSISSGRAKVTLTWNPDYVKLDPFFLNKLESRQDLKIDSTQAYIYNEPEGSVQFLMDQTLGEDDYVVLFYPVQGKKDNLIQQCGNKWDGMTQIISVSAEEMDVSQ